MCPKYERIMPMTLKSSLIPNVAFYSMLLDHINDGINVVDTQGVLIYVNDVSANYVGLRPKDMVGHPVKSFYPDAALLDVIQTQKPVLNKAVAYLDNRKYLVSAYPIFGPEGFQGGFSIFKSIDDIEMLNRKITFLESRVLLSGTEPRCPLIGAEGSLQEVLKQARKAVGAPGGPRHSIITGPSGTGKTALAAYIHAFALSIGVLEKNAPFVEVNCAQFTNPDMAAMEVFGSEKGAFTGSTEKKGLFELASGGILFLDEAHALGPHQTMLLKAIESGKVRRIGGTREIPVRVVLITASTQNLRDVFLPELYQRLAQNKMTMPPLDQRTYTEKRELLDTFVQEYVVSARERHQVHLKVSFQPEAAALLLNQSYPRNIRQFRDTVNHAIDQAAPLIGNFKPYDTLAIWVGKEHVISEETEEHGTAAPVAQPAKEGLPHHRVQALRELGMGPRRISAQLAREGWHYEYHIIAYYLKKHGL